MNIKPALISFLLLGVICLNAKAQKATTGDTTVVLSLVDSAKQLFVSDPGQSIQISLQAKKMSGEIGYLKGTALALKNLGIANYYQGNNIEALSYYAQASEIFKKINDQSGVSNMKNNIGAIYMAQGDDVEALAYYLESLKIADGISDTLRSLTALTNIGAVYSHHDSTLKKAIDYYLKALPLAERLNNQQAIGTISVNIGTIYVKEDQDQLALDFFNRSIKALRDNENEASPYIEKGLLYLKLGNHKLALEALQKAHELSSIVDNKLFMARALQGMASVYQKEKNDPIAIRYFRQAEIFADSIDASYELMYGDSSLAAAYARIGDYKSATEYHKKYEYYKDLLYNNDKDKRMANLQFDFDLERKEGEINLLKKDNELRASEVRRQKLARNISLLGTGFLLFAGFAVYRNYRLKAKSNLMLEKKNEEIETLILNILPAEVAEELKHNAEVSPKSFPNASVLFTDFKGFSAIAANMTPEEVITELNICFGAFDQIVERNKLEKIKTIGDSYMCAGGLPTPSKDHVFRIVNAAKEMLAFMDAYNQQRLAANQPIWEVRVGIHEGPVVAGVVGKKKYAYDIWGSAVNVASRMESSGSAGKLNVSETVYDQIKHLYACEHRGKVYAKNVGEIDMYFVGDRRFGNQYL